MTESDELSRLLATWAARNRLSTAQVDAVRAHVVAAVDPAPASLDAEWLWSLLRPLTALVDRLELAEPDEPAPRSAFGQPWTTYLQLA